MPQQWVQIHLAVPSDTIDSISEQLTAHGALAITLTPDEDSPLFQESPQAMPLTDQMTLTALFASDTDTTVLFTELEQIISADILSLAKTEIVAEQDWVSETQRQFQPTCFGKRLWVVPNWVTQDYPSPSVRLDPGLGFGTGNHPTTSLCLTWLTEKTLENKTVIDFGCGSGILSLAACALGAKHVYAIDHDEQAITATQHNLSLNPRLGARCDVGKASLLPDHYQADIIVANILAKPLIALFDTLTTHSKSGTKLILSGLLEADGPEIIMQYKPAFTLTHQEQSGEWIRLAFIKS